LQLTFFSIDSSQLFPALSKIKVQFKWILKLFKQDKK
jgi:hypothetical protein